LLATHRHLELAAHQTSELATTIDSKREQVGKKARHSPTTIVLVPDVVQPPGDNHSQLQRQMCRTQGLLRDVLPLGSPLESPLPGNWHKPATGTNRQLAQTGNWHEDHPQNSWIIADRRKQERIANGNL